MTVFVPGKPEKPGFPHSLRVTTRGMLLCLLIMELHLTAGMVSTAAILNVIFIKQPACIYIQLVSQSNPK